MAAVNAVYIGISNFPYIWVDMAGSATGINAGVAPAVLPTICVDLAATDASHTTPVTMPSLLPVTDFEGGGGGGGGGGTPTYKLRARDLGSPTPVYTTWVSTNPASSPPGAPPVGPWGENTVVQKWLV